MNKVWFSIDQAVKAAIIGLELENAKRVESQVFVDVSTFTAEQFPGVCICEHKGIRKGDRTSGGVWRWYPVDVFVVDKTPTHDRKRIYLDLIEDIANAFDGKRLDGATAVQFCEVDYEPAFDMSLEQYRHVAVGITLMFKVYLRA